MIKTDDLYYLGKILKTFGHEGELYVYLDVDEPKDYQNTESVFVALSGKPVPFFIVSFTLKQKKNAIIRFADVDKEFAELMTGASIYLPMENLPKLKGKKFYYHEIRGFTINDKQKGIIGAVKEVLEYPGNPVIETEYAGKSILLPMNDKFILKIDRKNKVIYMDIPEGLIDIYL